jgi:hypothetical protein
MIAVRRIIHGEGDFPHFDAPLFPAKRITACGRHRSAVVRYRADMGALGLYNFRPWQTTHFESGKVNAPSEASPRIGPMMVLRGERPRECSPTWRGMSLAIWKSTLNGKWKLLTNPVSPSFGLACLRNRYRKAALDAVPAG